MNAEAKQGDVVEKTLAEVKAELEERRRLRMPKWMRERPQRQYLPEPERKARRERNLKRKRLRPKVRRRRKHGRPLGR